MEDDIWMEDLISELDQRSVVLACLGRDTLSGSWKLYFALDILNTDLGVLWFRLLESLIIALVG